jgi:hypothetical protein
MKKTIESRTEAVREELKKPLPPHNPEKEKKMATKKKSRKASSKKKVSKKKVSKKAAKGAAKEKTARKSKAPVDGVTLKALADEAGITGQKARAKLRAAGIGREKGSRWVFGEKSKELKAARTALGL